MRSFRRVVAVATLLALPATAVLGAEIVMVQGQGEKTESAGPQPAGWVEAEQGDKVEGGFWVRTLANSQMALLVPARNQMRLAQNSVMQLKTEEESAEFTQARVKLAKGRAWSQARPRGGAPAAGEQPTLAMETPSATMSIRGTDWEVEVAEDGTTQLVVLSGQVDIGNEHGQLSVGKNEAARVEPGKAPVKLVLVDPQSRVQWVSSWQPQPARWIGDEAARYAPEITRIEAGDYAAALSLLEPRAATEPGAAVLASDLLIHDGQLARAVAVLEPLASGGAGDARTSALLARALVRLDRLDDAEKLLDSAASAHPADAGLLLARGELAVLRGDPARAESSFRAVLGDAAVGRASARQSTSAVGRASARQSTDESEAWYGLGLIASEREFVRQARKDLDHALAADPDLVKAAAERAAVETFAGNLDDAGARYDALIEQDGANYIALTGRGINRLKQGDPEAALQDFMRAGMIEPRYARAWLFQGVAFYQLGEHYRAEQALQKAQELDERDPIPHMMASQTAADRLEFGEAIVQARKAQENMPYLRSLNQLANDQKGSANLGSPIANFGMEEWAKFYADKAYSPYWGGSHLFLADRYTGPFNKSSELMQGFLTDPLAFGASNRESSLVQRPGNYGRLDFNYVAERYFNTLVGRATANGMLLSPGKLAYFVQGAYDDADSRKSATEGKSRELIGGFGWKPRYDLGFFAFAIDRDLDADVRIPRESATDEEAFPDQDQKQPERRIDIGVQFDVAPDNKLWLKAGDGEARIEQDGSLYSTGGASGLEREVPSILHAKASPNGSLQRFDFRVYSNDLQFRQSFDTGEGSISWGAEQSRQEQRHDFVMAFDAKTFLRDTVLRYLQHEEFVTDEETLYVSSKSPFLNGLELQADVFLQDVQSERFDTNRVQIFGVNFLPRYGPPGTVGVSSATNLNPRIGLKWEFRDGQMLRLVGQQWRRPGGLGTLSSVDTLGIALNDRLPSIGGKYDRARFQYDGEFQGKYFFQAYADREIVKNGQSGKRTPAFANTAEGLGRLRTREEFFTATDIFELTPVFPGGSVSSLGFGANVLATPDTSLSARYVWRDSENDSLDPRYHGEIPYVSEHYFELGSQWSLPSNWEVRAEAVYRSERYQNESDVLAPAQAGWSFRVKSYWETTDKRHTVQLVLDNLFLDQADMIRERGDQYVNLQYGYKF